MKTRTIRFRRRLVERSLAVAGVWVGLAGAVWAAEPAAGRPAEPAALEKHLAEMEKSAHELTAIDQEVRQAQTEVERLAQTLARQEAEEKSAQARIKEQKEWAERDAKRDKQLAAQAQAAANSQAETARLQTQLAELERTATKRKAEEARLRKELAAVRAQLEKTVLDAATAKRETESDRRRREEQWQEDGLVRQGKALREQLTDVRDPSLAWSLNDAGLVLAREQRWDEAAAMFRRALAIVDALPGRKAKTAAGTLHQHLGDVARAQGNPDAAQRHYQDAADVFRAELGAQHPRLAAALNGLACTLQDQGRGPEAEETFRQVVRIYERRGSADPAALAVALFNLGTALMDQRRLDEAGPLLERAVQVLETRVPGNEDKRAIMYRALIRYYRATGQPDQAANCEEKVIDLLAK